MTQQSPLQSPPVGAFRFNTDSSKLEYYDGNQWVNITSDSPQVQTGGTRGIWGGGNSPHTDTIDYVNIDSTGDATDFGNLVAATGVAATASSRIRGIWAGGYSPNDSTKTDKIDYVTISSSGINAQDFGDLLAARMGHWGLSSQTRGLFGQGKAPSSEDNVIQYITIASTGNAVDFGDASAVGYVGTGGASPTRGIFAMGISGAPTRVNVINYLTISTLGNSADFGDLTTARMPCGIAVNATRGIFGAGEDASAGTNVMDYVTIATLGNAADFGDGTVSNKNNTAGATSSPTRGVWGGGATPSNTNTMDYVQIMTIGNAIDFGDLSVARQNTGALSNGHGGLG